MKHSFKHDKAVAGTTILISLVAAIFTIGLLVMIFGIMGGELKDSSSVKASDSATVALNTYVVNSSLLSSCNFAPVGVLTAVTAINATGGETISSGNYTFSGCRLAATAVKYNNTAWNITYTYSYGGVAWLAMNSTVDAMTDSTDFFSLFIVIGSMVVLILLVVVILVAIRNSGMMSGTA